MKINKNMITESTRKQKPFIILDWDDTLCPLLSLIVDDVNKAGRFTPPLSIDEFYCWGAHDERTAVIFEYFDDASLYERQTPFADAQEFVRELSKYCEIALVTAIDSKFIDTRIQQCLKFFPEIKRENIFMGTNKSLINAMFMFDDGMHNHLAAINVPYRILRRQPWNQEMTGGLSANSCMECLSIIKNILGILDGDTVDDVQAPLVLVGPSASRKYELVAELEKTGHFKRPITWSDGNDSSRYHLLSPNEFAEYKENGMFIETTRYAQTSYGTIKADIDAILNNGQIPIMVLDICGAMAIKKEYPATTIAYTKRHTRDILSSIISEESSIEAKVNRIISLEAEESNISLCDITIDMNMGVESAANHILQLLI